MINIKTLPTRISDFISNRELKNNKEEDILFLKGFGQIAFDFVSAVFKGGWDQLKMDKNNKTFWELIKDKFTSKVPISNKRKKANIPLLAKLVNFLKLPPSQLSPRLSKKVLAKLKFHGKNIFNNNKKAVETTKPSYT